MMRMKVGGLLYAFFYRETNIIQIIYIFHLMKI